MPRSAPIWSRISWIPLLLCGCPGLIFGDGDGDGDGGGDGDSFSTGETEGSPQTTTPTEGGGGEQGGSNTQDPPTTGIEPTGADNELPEEDACPCVDDNQDIYVLSSEGTIWSFDPTDYSFDLITPISCGGMTSSFSMGVSRKGRAWVQYTGGDIYTVDLKDPGSPCKDPGFENDDPLFPNFGMAFVGNSSDDPCDKLYAHSGIAPGLSGPGVGALGVIDPQTLELSQIAPIDYAWGELTGTGSGRLFAFQGDSPPFIAEYDKANGELLGSFPLAGLENPSAFAFAFWGGDFYLFMGDPDFLDVSRVVHVDFDESEGAGKAITTIVESAPMRIVGAGVSTCAPQ